MEENLIHNKKTRADNYMSILIIISLVLYFRFFTLEAIVSLIVYPLTALAIYGVLKIIDGSKKKNNDGYVNINKILLGIISILFSVLFLLFILTQPGVTLHILLALIAFPMLFFGLAGIIKGLIVDIYSITQRVINIVVGFITLIISCFAFSSNERIFLLYIIIFFFVIIINVLSRAALYLSEYGLSLVQLRNFKLFFYIISDYILYVGSDGTVLVTKIVLD